MLLRSKKACVGRTDQGVDGYTPVAAYLGNEGWNIGRELRPGVRRSAAATHYFLERILPRVERLVAPDQAVLLRDDSGFDSAPLLFAKAQERDRWASLGRSFDFITAGNTRQQDKEAWVARAERAGAFVETRPGKRVAPLSIGWTSLTLPMAEVIKLYQHHGTHEPFHSEIKTDLERLPSGKFDTNDARLDLASFAYHSLRLIGQLGLTGGDRTDPPPGRTPKAQEGAAGDYLPGGPVCGPCAPLHPQVRAWGDAPCGGLRRRGGAAGQGGFAVRWPVRLVVILCSCHREGPGLAEGRQMA